MRKILITGYRGQIGSLLITKLLKKGYDVIGIDKRNIDFFNIEKFQGKKLKLYELDLSKEPNIDLSDVDVFIPLAAIVSNSNNIKDTKDMIHCNIMTIINILPLMKNLKQIIFPSSMMFYGEPIKSPIKENHPTNTKCIYGASKLYAEHLLFTLLKEINVSVLRIAAVYGTGNYGGDRANSFIPNLLKAIETKEPIHLFGEIYNKRDYVDAEDVAEAIYLSIKKPFNGVLNIGSGKGISPNELAKPFKVKKEKIKKTHKDYTLNISKARRLINYIPKGDIKDELIRKMQSLR